ncbi:exopolysaccharide biosynthesis polyprenyl glycosylphosphotransferase [Crenalkalicoccus roseus]|uniref:exopolysaccharide biosynthesis polyprenyl glycosylphosphotransferase n=1 Tax=Crenalkalicoccus roseus TaxID=1485588 RepID=UPI00108168A7|nr:exopolysaccharide biosynthesis polyprenyl glycosylphosphotransferase [Crenalkalicoccus roseus]
MTNLFGHSVRSELLALYVAETLACFVVIYLLLAWGIAGASPSSGGTIAAAAVLALGAGAVSGACGLYQPEAWSRANRLLLGTLIAGLLLLPLAWPALALLRPAPAEGASGRIAEILLAFAAVVVSTRLGFAAAVRSGVLCRRLAVIGGPGAVALKADPGEARPEPFAVALTLRPDGRLAEALAPERLRAQRIWAVLVADGATLPEPVRRRCEAAGVRLFSEAEFRERRLSRVDLDRLGPGWLATARATREGWLEAAIRRGFDIGLSLALLLLTLPLLLLTALAIKLDSPGPVFYRQERVGRGGRVFTLYKFRSMVVDAEANGAPCWASRGDPRVTRVGRLIRLTRIDEIPQALNVLRGDMAIVGPRPERPAFVEQLNRLIPHYRDRACVKPGITGWAQVNYPYGASVEDARMKLAYDLYYVRRRSLFLDLLILIATVRVVLFQEGAR